MGLVITDQVSLGACSGSNPGPPKSVCAEIPSPATSFVTFQFASLLLHPANLCRQVGSRKKMGDLGDLVVARFLDQLLQPLHVRRAAGAARIVHPAVNILLGPAQMYFAESRHRF